MCYHLKEDNIVKHDFYVDYMTIANIDPSCHILYMDYRNKNNTERKLKVIGP